MRRRWAGRARCVNDGEMVPHLPECFRDLPPVKLPPEADVSEEDINCISIDQSAGFLTGRAFDDGTSGRLQLTGNVFSNKPVILDNKDSEIDVRSVEHGRYPFFNSRPWKRFRGSKEIFLPLCARLFCWGCPNVNVR